MTQEEKNVYKNINIITKKRKTNRNVDIEEEGLKHFAYAKVLEFVQNYLYSMKNKFETRAILITVTDTRQSMLYPPSVHLNSGLK